MRKVVTHNKTDYVIVVARHALPQERFAAEELQKYVQQMTGVLIAIHDDGETNLQGPMILIGASRLTKRHSPEGKLRSRYRDDDSFQITTKGPHLIVIGCNGRGTLFGVYTLLEKWGCRWIEPGPGGEVIPKCKELLGDHIQCTQRPSNKIRGTSAIDMVDRYRDQDVIDHLDWMAKNRMNWFQIVVNYGWEKHKHLIVRECRKRGLMLQGTVFTHMFWLPISLAKEHPEYFAINNSKRSVTKTFGSQRCASNKEAVALYVKNATAWLKRNPGFNNLCILPNDGYGWCECDKCKKLLPKEQFARFYDPLVRALRRVNGEVKLFNYVYCGRYELPDNMKVYQQTGGIQFDTFIRCRWHALNSQKCTCAYSNLNWQGGNGDLNGQGNVNKYLASALKKWRKTIRGDIFVFENIARRSLDSTPFPNAHVVAEDARYFHQVGANGIMCEMFLQGWSSYALEMYVVSRIYWDVNADVDGVIDDYCSQSYGKGWRHMRAYFDCLEECGRGICNPNHWKLITNMSSQALTTCAKHLRQAAGAEKSGACLLRIEKQKQILKYMKLLWKGSKQHLRVQACLKRDDQKRAEKENQIMLDTYVKVWHHMEANSDIFDALCHQYFWLVSYLTKGRAYNTWGLPPKLKQTALSREDREFLRAGKYWDYLLDKIAQGAYQTPEAMDLDLRCRINSIYEKIIQSEMSS